MRLLAAGLVAAVAFVGAQTDECTATYGKDEAACLANVTCDWCKCAAVPSSCISAANAKRLPPGVFTCANATTPDCSAATSNATCAKTVACSWCVQSNEDGEVDATTQFCANYKNASALPKTYKCFGPY